MSSGGWKIGIYSKKIGLWQFYFSKSGHCITFVHDVNKVEAQGVCTNNFAALFRSEAVPILKLEVVQK